MYVSTKNKSSLWEIIRKIDLLKNLKENNHNILNNYMASNSSTITRAERTLLH